MHGRTTSIYGATTLHTASEVHGIGAVTMTHGTTAIGIGTDGHTHHGAITADGTTHGITEEYMTHGTTEEYMTHGTTGDGTATDI